MFSYKIWMDNQGVFAQTESKINKNLIEERLHIIVGRFCLPTKCKPFLEKRGKQNLEGKDLTLVDHDA